VLVSGAGIVSLALAWRLQRDGAQVAIVDPEPPGDGGASFGNAGAISSTSVVPLAMPGLLKQVPRMRSIHRRRCVCHCAIACVLRHGCCALAAPRGRWLLRVRPRRPPPPSSPPTEVARFLATAFRFR